MHVMFYVFHPFALLGNSSIRANARIILCNLIRHNINDKNIRCELFDCTRNNSKSFAYLTILGALVNYRREVFDNRWKKRRKKWGKKNKWKRNMYVRRRWNKYARKTYDKPFRNVCGASVRFNFADSESAFGVQDV